MDDGKTVEALHDIQLLMQKFGTDLDAFKKDITARVDRIDKKATTLHHLVAGNGGSNSIILRLTLVETRLAQLEIEQQTRFAKQETAMTQAANDIENLQTTEVAWRNRIIGIVSFIAFVNGLLAIWAMFFH